MLQTIVIRTPIGVAKAGKLAGLALAGTSVVALMIGWVSFLLWLFAEIVMSIVHWL